MKSLVLAALFVLGLWCSQAIADPASVAVTLALKGIELYANTPKALDVIAEGSGNSLEAASKSAILAAASQAAGSMIVSKQVSSNDRLVIDDIIQHTTGIVSRYEVLSCSGEGDRYRCRIKATVSTISLQHELKSHGATVQGIDGAGAYAEQVTTRNSIQEGRKLVLDALNQVREKGLDLKVSRFKIIPGDQAYAYAEISYSAELNANWLDYVSEVIGRVAKANADGPYGREPGLGVEVLKPKFWKASGDQMHDPSLGKDILNQLKRLQMIDVEIQFKDRGDSVIGTACSVYKSDFYPMNGPSIVMIDGTRTEWTTWRVAVPEAILPDVDHVTLKYGCSTKGNLQITRVTR